MFYICKKYVLNLFKTTRREKFRKLSVNTRNKGKNNVRTVEKIFGGLRLFPYRLLMFLIKDLTSHRFVVNILSFQIFDNEFSMFMMKYQTNQRSRDFV